MTFDNYTIRLIKEDEGEKFFRVIDANRSRLEDFFSGTVARTRSLEDTIAYVAEIVQKAEQKTYLPHIVVDNGSGEIAGFIDIKNIDWKLPKGEMGCFFDEAHTRQGLAEKAMRLVVDHMQNDHGFIKLFLRTHEGNTTAKKLAEKCGFEVEGVIRKDYKTTKGEVVDLLYYGLVKSGQ
jgi:RimJ/RimL family protein N-acetyltransferase